MAKHRFSGRTADTFVIAEEFSDDTLIFTARSKIDVVGGIGIDVYAHNTTIIVGGIIEVDPGYAAIISDQLDTSIALRKEAVTGLILCDEENASIINKGTIDSGNVWYDAVYIDGDFSELRNYGTITGRVYGASNYNARIFNEETGVIRGIVSVGADNAASYLENRGKIVGTYTGSNSNDTIFNSGIIKGDVQLDDGKDVFDGRGGTVTGLVYGGPDDDVYIFSRAKDTAEEYDGQGEDIVKSTASYTLDPTYYVERLELIGHKNANATGTGRYEELWGNSGDNVLNGRGGSDYLDGKGGDDLLKSGVDVAENSFFFRTGYDHDTIQHFDVGLDNVYLGGWNAIDDFADLLSHARNKGDDVVITAGKDSLTIMDMHKNDLQTGDFSFLA